MLCWRGLWLSLLLLGLALLGVRYWLAPQVAGKRAEIETALSVQLGLPVKIAALQASWHGLHPELRIQGMQVLDQQQRVALELPQVDAAIAWSSLWRWRPVLARLELQRPLLDIRREADGRIFIAGLALEGGGDSDSSQFADFVLAQKRIVIRDARLRWTDALRAAPPLSLEKLSLRLENSGDRHRFALMASPPAAYSANLDLRGDLQGGSLTHWRDWSGKLFLSLDEADLAVWQQWIDYPLALPRGRGGVRAWLDFDGARLARLDVDLALAGVAVRLEKRLKMLELASLQGKFSLARVGDEFDFNAQRLSLATREGLKLGPTELHLRYREAGEQGAAGGEFKSGELDVRILAQLAAYLPLPKTFATKLVEAEPGGVVERFSLSWQGEIEQPAQFALDTAFRDLQLAPLGALPGFSGLSGEIKGDEQRGDFRLKVNDGGLNAPAALHEAVLPITTASLAGGWSHEPARDGGADALTLRLRNLVLANPHLAGEFSAYWQARAGTAGYLDLKGSTTRKADIAAAWRYIPSVAPYDVVDWLQSNLKGGEAALQLAIRGNLDDFPFHQSEGEFRLQASFEQGQIAHFAPGWPGMDALRGSLDLDRQRLTILASTGSYLAARASDVKVEIADLMAEGQQVLTVDGQAAGPSQDFLRYLTASRLGESIGGFTGNARAQGNGKLGLHIAVPLHDSHNTRVKGEFRFAGNQLHLLSALPEFSQAGGVLSFTEHGIAVPGVQAQFLGRRLDLKGLTEADGTVALQAEGGFTIASVRQLLPSAAWDRLNGGAAASARLRIRAERIELEVSSALQGVGSDLPNPLTKGVAESWPLSLGWVQEADAQRWRLSLGDRLSLGWDDECRADTCRTVRGGLASGQALSLPGSGWQFSGRFGLLDSEQWLPVLNEVTDSLPSGAGDGRLGLDVVAESLLAGGHRFNQLQVRGHRQRGRWQLQAQGPDLAGELEWREAGAGSLHARLSRLSLQPVEAGFVPLAERSATPRELPALDLQAEQFRLRSLELGSLRLQAGDGGQGAWVMRELMLQAPDMKLSGSGVWRPRGPDAGTRLDFDLDSDDVGAMLARLGFPDTVRGGKVDFNGKLGWRGLPSSIDYASLAGTTALSASQGQFRQMEPGAAGRLLGILSLQSLPRRLTLDFRDLYAEGFAFDSIKGEMNIEAGLLRTRNLEVRGPAARVYIVGSTDLGREVHELTVRVQPTLSETVAVGVIVGQVALGVFNPAIGAAAYVAQKLLQDPVEKIFSYDYLVSGPWADPKVEKKILPVVQAPAASAPE